MFYKLWDSSVPILDVTTSLEYDKNLSNLNYPDNSNSGYKELKSLTFCKMGCLGGWNMVCSNLREHPAKWW